MGTNVNARTGDTVVVIGASYARGWKPESLWGANVVNKGASGEQTHEMLARFDDDVLALEPQMVIIWGFINDIYRSGLSQIEKKF